MGARIGRHLVHLDLHAGSGWNSAAGCKGSPLAYLDAAQRAGNTNFTAFFVDHDPEALSILRKRLEFDNRLSNRVHIVRSDNEVFLRRLDTTFKGLGAYDPLKVFGSVLVDPNGLESPWEELERVFGKYPNLDLVMRFSGTTWKRKHKSSLCKGYSPTPAQVLRTLNRNHAIISEPVTAHQASVLVARNRPFKGKLPKGFHPIYSKGGIKIQEKLLFTSKERGNL